MADLRLTTISHDLIQFKAIWVYKWSPQLLKVNDFRAASHIKAIYLQFLFRDCGLFNLVESENKEPTGCDAQLAVQLYKRFVVVYKYSELDESVLAKPVQVCLI